MSSLWGREPALIIGLAQAGAAVAVGFGADVTPEQVGLIIGFVAAALSVVTRSQVTPVKQL